MGKQEKYLNFVVDDLISKTSTTVTIVNPNRGVTVSGYYIFSN